MPWQEVCVQEQRVRFIHEWQKQEDSMAELCRRYGISRRVGYKWLGRYKQDGIEGLQNRSREPKRHPNQTPPRTKSVTYVLGLNCYLSPGLLTPPPPPPPPVETSPGTLGVFPLLPPKIPKKSVQLFVSFLTALS